MSNDIKTWQERLPDGVRFCPSTTEMVPAMQAEIAELRARILADAKLIAEQNRLAKERQEWALQTNKVIRDLRAALALAQAPSAPVAPDTVRDLDRIGMQFAAELCKLPVVGASRARNVDYLARQDVMDLVVAWRAAWDKNSASRPPIDRAALSVQAEPALNAIEPDAVLLDFLDSNLKMTMGWRVGIAPAGNVSVQSIIACKTTIREAIHAAIATKHAAILAAPTPPTTGEAPRCRNQGGMCACRSGGSFGGCALERASPPPTLAQQVAAAQAETATWSREKRSAVRVAGSSEPTRGSLK